jgi:hypothetical protein
MPMLAQIEPTKNPKWLDLLDPTSKKVNRHIYELDGDKLRICGCSDGRDARPAEFSLEPDSATSDLEFHREKLPPTASDKALIGSWNDSNLEIFDGFLFALIDNHGGKPKWIGGRYTVDTTKNPKWIDVDLFSAYPSEKITKLYGSYEVVDGQLKIALGLNGKRSIRPLEFKTAGDVLFFDVKKTTTPRSASINNADIPDSKPNIKSEDLLFQPLNLVQKLDEGNEEDRGYALMKEGKYDLAESCLRNRLSASYGLQRTGKEFLICVCLIQRASKSMGPEAQNLRDEALSLARQVIEETDHKKDMNETAKWFCRAAGIRVLQILLLSKKNDRLLAEATKIRENCRGTVEELIVLSLIYRALTQDSQNGDKQAHNWADEVWNQMKELFYRLPSGAFTESSNEYSRDYWEKYWFTR